MFSKQEADFTSHAIKILMQNWQFQGSQKSMSLGLRTICSCQDLLNIKVYLDWPNNSWGNNKKDFYS